MQRSKRLEKQQLMGRFAESDGDDSDSPPSEVIGRGFDRTYQDFFDAEMERGGQAETKASCSTNTKMSDLNTIGRRMSTLGRDKFTTFASSYNNQKFI
jgi:hypothetical protein